MAMTPSDGGRRRRDLKTQDREKSMSPLDKDQLKKRCLERVRSERSRVRAHVRERRGSTLTGDGVRSHAEATSFEVAEQGERILTPPDRMLSSAMEILEQGLDEFSASKRSANRRNTTINTSINRASPNIPRTQNRLHRENRLAQVPAIDDPIDVVESHSSHHDDQEGGESPSSYLESIAEEAAYRNAYGGTRTGAAQLPHPEAVNFNLREVADGAFAPEAGAGGSGGNLNYRGDDVGGERGAREGNMGFDERLVEMELNEGGVEGDDEGDTLGQQERLLSPEEYLEMVHYIEEACREEDLKAEAELIEEYEVTRRLEEEAVKSEISSGLDFDVHSQDNSVLCPVCKRGYLLQPGPPSSSIVCACGFRLDTGGDRLGLEHLKQQLAETYEQHSASCSADPSFSVEGAHGLDILWSSCDGCGFARVVL